MKIKSALSIVSALCLAIALTARNKPETRPLELEVLKASVGIWDAEIEVWPQGLDSPSIKFKGVETNRAYGEYWIASDFDSEYKGQTVKVHSIVGYDLEQKKLVGRVIDHGPYTAYMTGEYDKESATVTWMTRARTAAGKPMVQKTVVTEKNGNQRILVLFVPGKMKKEWNKFMQIRFIRRK